MCLKTLFPFLIKSNAKEFENQHEAFKRHENNSPHEKYEINN